MKSKQIYKAFYTGIVALPDEIIKHGKLFKGKGWYIRLEKQRDKFHKVRNGKEVVIYAKSWISAQRALNLFLGSLYLYSGNPPEYVSDNFIAYNESETPMDNYDIIPYEDTFKFSTNNIPVACKIAAKASHRRKWVYAITKYKVCISLFGIFHVDLDPHLTNKYFKISQFPEDHILFSNVIVTCYSAIEDLGLHIKASQDKPSTINGSWNPIVKSELENQLLQSGININEEILWTLRGPIRKPEKKKPIPIVKKESWSFGPIRDSEVELIDAIANISWLRSKIASHGTKDLTKSISPYDVVNVQHLTRRLILESMGFWRYLQEMIKSQK